MKRKKQSRREFLSLAAGLTAITALLPKFLSAEERRRGGASAAAGPLKECPVSDPAMRNIGYVSDHSQVTDNNQKLSRSGVEFKDQHCKDCSFYQGKKTDKLAKCQLAPAATCGVKGTGGWCPSWQKKA